MTYSTNGQRVQAVGRRWLSALVYAAVMGCASSALAQTSADELARRHFESGAAYLEQSDYDAALREFDKAYELSKRPEILINLATVQERMGNLDGAISSLEEYVKVAPAGPHTETVQVRLANLKERKAKIDAEKPQEQTPPAAAPAAETTPTPAPAATASPAADETSEGSSKIPAYVLFSVAGVALGGSILTGVLANGEHGDLEDRCAPNCTDDDVATGETLALTSTILTGVAVVTGAIGAVLFFNSGPEKTARHRGPEVGLGIGPRAGLAHARWRF